MGAGVLDVARAEQVTIDQVADYETDGDGTTESGVKVDLTTTIPLDRDDEDQTAQDIMDYLNGTKPDSTGSTLISTLRVAAPTAITSEMAVSVATAQVEIDVRPVDVQVEETRVPSEPPSDDKDDGLSTTVIVVIAVASLILSGACTFAFCCLCCGCGKRRKKDEDEDEE